jgi:hypothetical protein
MLMAAQGFGVQTQVNFDISNIFPPFVEILPYHEFVRGSSVVVKVLVCYTS